MISRGGKHVSRFRSAATGSIRPHGTSKGCEAGQSNVIIRPSTAESRYNGVRMLRSQPVVAQGRRPLGVVACLILLGLSGAAQALA